MARPRKHRHQLSGVRLRIAMKALGMTVDELAGHEIWQETVKVKRRTISYYIESGVPDENLAHVARVFNIPKCRFLDEGITNDEFENWVLQANGFDASKKTPDLWQEVRMLHTKWENADHQYFLLPRASTALQAFIQHPPPEIKIPSSVLKPFMVLLSLHYGGNILFLFSQISATLDMKTIDHIINIFSITYVRPPLRALFVL